MSLEVEGVVDGGVSGEKSLRGTRILEADQRSFSSSNRLMRILRPIARSTNGDVSIA
jgi:hypothetical protein